MGEVAYPEDGYLPVVFLLPPPMGVLPEEAVDVIWREETAAYIVDEPFTRRQLSARG